jgi:hypothetical protein
MCVVQPAYRTYLKERKRCMGRDRAREDNRYPRMQGLASHMKKFRLYPTDNGKPLKVTSKRVI